MNKLNFFNIEAEKAILGALFINNNLYDEIRDIISSESFYLDSHQQIYSLIEKIIERGQVADAITVSQLATTDPKFKDIITLDYLTEIAANTVNTISLKDYATVVHNLFIKRELYGISQSILNELSTNEDANSSLSYAEESLYNLAENSVANTGIKNFSDTLETAYELIQEANKREDGISGVKTNFIDIDKKLGGLQNSDLIILAGRPSMGKTALATNIAFNVALQNQGSVLLFSLEMSAEQLATRILSQRTHISTDELRRGINNQAKLNSLIQEMSKLKSVPIFIDDSHSLTISDLRTKCRKFKRKNNLKLVVIDYVQLMSTSRKSDNRVLEISEITRGLKAVAKELNIPILALSQLSRAVENRDDKKPMLSDLRESGSIEQDADIVSFIFREEYYKAREEPIIPDDKKDTDEKYLKWKSKLEEIKGIATFIIAKNRHGPIGNIDLLFNSEYTIFQNLQR